MMNLKELINSSLVRRVLLVAAGAVVLVFVFSAGVFVGIEKVKFSYGWGENYYRNFVDPRGLVIGPIVARNPFWDKNYLSPHGLVGQIIEVNENGFVLLGANQNEVPVEVDSETIIKNQRNNLKLSDLKIGDQAVVFGAPDDQGEIEAKLVRIDSGIFH
jgi:cell shape-determining protein MreC